MRAAIVIATGLGLALCGHAEAQEGAGFWSFGMGSRSCAYWLSNDMTENAGEYWIAGYWAGQNNSLNAGIQIDHMVGHTSDGEGIYGEVKKRCKEHPSELLYWATGTVYIMFREQKR